MSLTKLLMAPVKLFRKEVINFVIIRRYDLGIMDETLQYVAVKPTASITVLRYKVWKLLDLPDYCDEIIILKSSDECEIPLTELRKGNVPQRPFFLEVWPPRQTEGSNLRNYDRALTSPTESVEENNESLEKICNASQSSYSHGAAQLNHLRDSNDDVRKQSLSCKFSRSSLFKLNGRKSQDNFTGLLLKIHNDLSMLSNKLSALETKITSS